MNDDFIYRALPEIRREFTQALYEKISGDTSTVSRPEKYLKLRSRHWLPVMSILLGLVFLIAWTQLRFLIRYVPVGELWLIEFDHLSQAGSAEPYAPPIIPSPLPTPRFFDPALTQIPEVMIEQLLFPSWTPDGFQAESPPSEMIVWEETLGIWSNEAEETIRLFVVGRVGGMRPYAPVGMWKEVRVNSQPAVLIYGRLALTSSENPRAQREWDETLGLQLHWIIGERVYALETFGPYVLEQDLIRMAESVEVPVPPWVTVTP